MTYLAVMCDVEDPHDDPPAADLRWRCSLTPHHDEERHEAWCYIAPGTTTISGRPAGEGWYLAHHWPRNDTQTVLF